MGEVLWANIICSSETAKWSRIQSPSKVDSYCGNSICDGEDNEYDRVRPRCIEDESSEWGASCSTTNHKQVDESIDNAEVGCPEEIPDSQRHQSDYASHGESKNHYKKPHHRHTARLHEDEHADKL